MVYRPPNNVPGPRRDRQHEQTKIKLLTDIERLWRRFPLTIQNKIGTGASNPNGTLPS